MNGTGAVIVGAGASGHACAAALRNGGFAGRVRLVNGEGGPPVNRTLVDKGVLPGLLPAELIALPPVDDVELVSGRAIRLDPDAGEVQLASGTVLEAQVVVLACGSSPRGVGADVAVADGAPLRAVHTAADALSLRDALPEPAGSRVVVLGAGFIGSELAHHYAGAGARVTVVARSPQPLRAALGERIATALSGLHRSRVDARFGVRVRAIDADGTVRAVGAEGCADEAIPADLVIVAQGAEAATAWAGYPGGVPVDSRLRVAPSAGAAATDAPTRVYAAGGSAILPLGPAGARVDHWDDAVAQGRHAAAMILADCGIGDDPGAYVPRAGFTLAVHGSVVAGRGVRLPGADERDDGALVEFVTPEGVLTGVAGIDAGPAVAAAGRRIAAIPAGEDASVTMRSR